MVRNSGLQTIIANGGIVQLNIGEAGVTVLSLFGTWTGTIQFEATADGQNWVSVVDQFNGSLATSTTGNGVFQFNLAGFTAFRARASALSLGPVSVLINAVDIGGSQYGAVTASVGSSTAMADGVANPSLSSLQAYQKVFNGATWDRQRTPVVFKTFSGKLITSEQTIWTPTSGKKFRLMGIVISQGILAGDVTLKDNTAGTTIFVVPANTIGNSIFIPLGNGILSATINNVLTATGSATETISGVVFGTEE